MGEIGHFGKNILKYMNLILNKLTCSLSPIIQASLSLICHKLTSLICMVYDLDNKGREPYIYIHHLPD